MTLAARERPAPGPVPIQFATAVEQQRRKAAGLLQWLRRRAIATRGTAGQRTAHAVVDDDEVQRSERELELLAVAIR
ncbi:MAG: hypothetical protein QOI48_2296 [Solirubrobacteraceae bacterium]|nr:hypothetical protein [Solirubrobacteraceae bacterium]